MKWSDKPTKVFVESYENEYGSEKEIYKDVYYLEAGNFDLNYTYKKCLGISLQQDTVYKDQYWLYLFDKRTSYTWFEGKDEDGTVEEIKVLALQKLLDEIFGYTSILQKLSTAIQMDKIQERICREGTLIETIKPDEAFPSLPLIVPESFIEVKPFPPVIWSSAEKSES